MKNNTTILDSFTETETIKEERERTVIDVVDVEVKTNYLVLQITKKDAQLLAALGDPWGDSWPPRTQPETEQKSAGVRFWRVQSALE